MRRSIQAISDSKTLAEKGSCYARIILDDLLQQQRDTISYIEDVLDIMNENESMSGQSKEKNHT